MGFQEIKQRETQNVFSLLFKWFAASMRTLRSALAAKLSDGKLVVVESLEPQEAKTKSNTQAEAPKTASLFDLSGDWFTTAFLIL